MSEYLGTSKRDMGLNTAPLDMCVLGSADCLLIVTRPQESQRLMEYTTQSMVAPGGFLGILKTGQTLLTINFLPPSIALRAPFSMIFLHNCSKYGSDSIPEGLIFTILFLGGMLPDPPNLSAVFHLQRLGP